MDNIIRLAHKGDLPAMLEIYSYYVCETAVSLEYEPPSLSEFARRFDAFTEAFPWLVCEQGGEISGYAYAHRFHERTAYNWSSECTVYVKNGLQGRGIGRALYSCLLSTLRLQRYSTAVGIISVPNESSEALHRALGFECRGLIDNAGYKSGAWRSVAWYVLALSDYPANPALPLPIGEIKDTHEFVELLSSSAK